MRSHVLLLSAALWLVAGCGEGGGAGRPVRVHGKLTQDGSPVAGAMITFIPEGGAGQRASGLSGDDGTFKLTTRNTGDGAAPGTYIVTVAKAKASTAIGPDPKSADYRKQMEGLTKKRGESRVTPTKTKGEIHSNYGDEKTTTLKYEVPPGGLPDLEIKLNKQGS